MATKTKVKEIKVEPGIWIAQKRESMIRKEKAQAYSDRCKRRKEAKLKHKRMKTVLGSCVCSAIFISGIVFTCKPATQEVSANEAVYTAEIKETEYVYPDCNVIEQYDKAGYTYLICEMPNGELHDYMIEDAPEGKIDIVCFRTNNQEDYNSYKVVNTIQLSKNYINLESIDSCDITETGILLNLEDGTGYYLEINEN